LFYLLDHRAAVEDLHIMLQREVIARMAAKAGDSDYGRLTVMLAPWVSIEHLFDVGPGAFTPPPRVWSAVARLTVRAEPAFPVSEHFGAVVAAAFAHRRKTIRKRIARSDQPRANRGSGLDPGARPETFPPEAFNLLAQKIVDRRQAPEPSAPAGKSAMTEYRRVLLVVDLSEDSLLIGRRAQAVATALGAAIDLLHVVEICAGGAHG